MRETLTSEHPSIPQHLRMLNFTYTSHGKSKLKSSIQTGNNHRNNEKMLQSLRETRLDQTDRQETLFTVGLEAKLLTALDL